MVLLDSQASNYCIAFLFEGYNTTVPILEHHGGVTVMQVLAVREEAAGGGHALELL